MEKRNPKITCKCGKVFTFLLTKNQKPIPVLWDTLDEEEKKSVLLGIPVPYQKFTNTAPPMEKHKTHFIDCPYENKFRRK